MLLRGGPTNVERTVDGFAEKTDEWRERSVRVCGGDTREQVSEVIMARGRKILKNEEKKKHVEKNEKVKYIEKCLFSTP